MARRSGIESLSSKSSADGTRGAQSSTGGGGLFETEDYQGVSAEIAELQFGRGCVALSRRLAKFARVFCGCEHAPSRVCENLFIKRNRALLCEERRGAHYSKRWREKHLRLVL